MKYPFKFISFWPKISVTEIPPPIRFKPRMLTKSIYSRRRCQMSFGKWQWLERHEMLGVNVRRWAWACRCPILRVWSTSTISWKAMPDKTEWSPRRISRMKLRDAKLEMKDRIMIEVRDEIAIIHVLLFW